MYEQLVTFNSIDQIPDDRERVVRTGGDARHFQFYRSDSEGPMGAGDPSEGQSRAFNSIDQIQELAEVEDGKFKVTVKLSILSIRFPDS